MSKFREYSDRTKRRKISSEVSKLLREIQTVNNENDMPQLSLLDVDCSASVNAVSEGVDLTAESGNQELGCSQQSVSDDRRNNLLTFDTDLKDSFGQSDEAQLSDCDECDDWTAREIFSDEETELENCDNESSVGEKLAEWHLKFNVSQAALSDLLKILQPSIADLPKDARTLLRTPRNIEIKEMDDGEYYYFGLRFWLQSLLHLCSQTTNTLTVHVNIDGIPLFSSSNTCLWPVLCSVKEFGATVFPVALYCNYHKPECASEYLKDFIDEMKLLEQVGYSDNSGKMYTVKLGAVVCDAPARAFVKCIKGHSGYDSCERCVQRGEWCGNRKGTGGKPVLSDLSAPLRTDISFHSKQDKAHHAGTSPFSELQCGMVTSFPLDYMHLVCLGVVRRLIGLWVHGPKPHKLSQTVLSAISDRLTVMQQHIPREFSRKPRSLSEYKLWKATELRLFLLYTGPVVMKEFLLPEVYSNFLDLSVAVRLLLCPSLVEHYVDYAEKLLKYFVESFVNLYEKNQLVYNVHSLIHLADDARHFGVLDNVSAFKYENFLRQLKKLVRRPQAPCAQIVRRVLEGQSRGNIFAEKNEKVYQCVFSRPHMEGPAPVSMSHCQQFKQYNAMPWLVSTSTGDNCFLVGGKIGVVKNIIREGGGESRSGYVLFEEFTNCKSFFTDPLDSADISLYFVSKPSGIKNVIPVSLTKTTCKCVLLPYKREYVAIRLIHD